MTLGEKRRQFSLDISILIVWANREGYGIAIDDVKAHDGHMKNSKHYDGLAADLNLYHFVKSKENPDGKWIWETGKKGHDALGEEWERMGHKWGGRFKTKGGGYDYNHYES